MFNNEWWNCCLNKEVHCKFPGYLTHGKVLLVGHMGLYDYRGQTWHFANSLYFVKFFSVLHSVLRLNFWLIFPVNATSFPWHIYHACPYQTLRQENHKQQTNSVRLWQGLQPQTRWAEHGVACPEQLGTEFPRKSVISGNLGIGGLILTFDARPRPWQRINSFFMCLSHAENNVRHFPGDPMGATCLDGEWSPKAIPTCESKNHPSIK